MGVRSKGESKAARRAVEAHSLAWLRRADEVWIPKKESRMTSLACIGAVTHCGEGMRHGEGPADGLALGSAPRHTGAGEGAGGGRRLDRRRLG